MAGIQAAFDSANVAAYVGGLPQIFHAALGLRASPRNWSDLGGMDRPRSNARRLAAPQRVGVGARGVVSIDRA
jgi:hypothetical protein